MTKLTVIEVNADCEITYSDGSWKPCQHRPAFTFADCDPGYGSHGECPKWDYYHTTKKPLTYDDAYYTIQDIRDAEVKTRGIIGHEDIATRLEFLISRGIVELPWFRFTDTERDIISEYCGIKPRFHKSSNQPAPTQSDEVVER
jgi:hypothetical protein